MDLKSISKSLASSRHRMHLLSPDGKPLYLSEEGLTTEETQGEPVIWLLVGQDSPEFRSGVRAVFEYGTRKRRRKTNFDEAYQKRIDQIAAGIVGWENMIWEGTERLNFTVENLMTVLEGYAPGLEQADQEIGDRGNFLGTEF